MSENNMAASADADASVGIEQVRLLYANLPVTQIVTLLVASALMLVQWPAVDHAWASGWMICLSLTALARIFLGVYFHRADPAIADAARWKKYFLIMAGIAGIVWGSTAFALYPTDSVVHQVFLAFVLAGMVAGGITALTPMLSAFRVFAVLSLAPVIARYLA